MTHDEAPTGEGSGREGGPGPQLWLDPETMRTLAYRTVDRLIDSLGTPGDAPILMRATRLELERRLGEDAPEEPHSFDELLERLDRDVFAFRSRGEHPGYFAFIPACQTWIGALADLMASALNLYAGSWMDGAGVTQLELVVLEWFRQWIGMPDDAGGILLGGGSAANMTALACARETLLGSMSDTAVLYVSDQSHSSMARAARLLGFGADQVRILPTDEHFRMRPGDVIEAMDADRRVGRRPLFLAATGGATNTGTVDPLEELAAVCHERGVWLHVDAAYGGFAALTERGRAELTGIGAADSVTLDPHKWLFQPFECGALMVRDTSLLKRAFEIMPDYLRDTEVAIGEVNFSDFGLQLTRTTRALKIWLTVQYFGLTAIRGAIDHAIDLAEHAQARIEADDRLELMNPRRLSLVCFRKRIEGASEDGEALGNADLVARLEATGDALVSSTRLHGRYAVRLCVINHTSRMQDVDLVLDWFVENVPSQTPESGSELRESVTDGSRGWLDRATPELETLRELSLFASLTQAELASVTNGGREERYRPGDVILSKWDGSRDFFVVREGEIEVQVKGRGAVRMGPGGFFGEIAAIDWGAGFGYARTASVVSVGDSRLIVIPALVFNELVRGSEDFRAQIEGAAPHRMAP